MAAALLVTAACSSGRGPSDGGRGSEGAPSTTAAAVAGGYGRPVLLGNIADPAVTESSGVVASRQVAGRYWTHNDSDDGPRLYCLDHQARSCGTWTVPGIDAFDWEDIASGPGPRPGVPYLYVGDIGDNLATRASVVVHRVPEPAPGASPGATEAAEALTLRYPDGPRDAEALLVHPDSGDVYVVAKDAPPGVYVARAPLAAGSVRTMEKVATLPIEGVGVFGAVTGGDIAPDGRRVALCTYLGGYELVLPGSGGAFDDIWAQPLADVALGARPQGEGIAYRADGRALVTTSERRLGGPAPMHQVERAP
ncbi:MAG: WD40 repeat domain-containing protein [Acidimicrobiia bacterium]